MYLVPERADRALVEAVNAGAEVRGSTSPNPPVGCAIFDDYGTVIATGGTEPVGGRHAEIVALDTALERVGADALFGANMAVTLEPCNHTGRTRPCTEAIVEAGIAKVYYANPDPNPVAAGGAAHLRAHGVEVERVDFPVDALQPWLTSARLNRPCVTVKYASTLDGFTAAPDGTSQWITAEETRQHVHYDRALRDAIIVGTGTAIADNPSLTARNPDGTLMANQPRRVVVGTRQVPAGNLTRLGFEQYATLEEALARLHSTGARDVLVEGGAGLIRSVIEADMADWIHAYIAPMFFGAGRGVVDSPLVNTLSQARRYHTWDAYTLGTDTVIELRRHKEQA